MDDHHFLLCLREWLKENEFELLDFEEIESDYFILELLSSNPDISIISDLMHIISISWKDNILKVGLDKCEFICEESVFIKNWKSKLKS